MRNLRYAPLFIILYLLPFGAVAQNTIDHIAELIKQANTAELEKQFAPTVDITILKDEHVYSKTQASIVLNKFFTQNKPKSVKIFHKVNTNNSYRFGVILLTTDKGVYRVSFTMNGANGNLQIIDMRIEAEKA